MKRPLVIGLIAIAALFIFVRYQAQLPQNNSTQNNPNPHEQFQSERFQTMLEDEEHTLLAIKHGVRIDTVKGILADYDSAFWGITDLHEPEKTPQLIFPEATNTSEVIVAISNKYAVPAPAVASLLIDRKLMQERSDE